MVTPPGFLRLCRMRILRHGRSAYDQQFHDGINIIRGQNGSGKSTIADFIFFILGGEFDDWKDAAKQCDEAQAEIETPRGKMTLKRQIAGSQEPIFVFFGPMDLAAESSLEGWQRFPIRRKGDRESFSQVMFRSLLIPEATSDGSANITMHQLLRVCYSDQRTPAARLFRSEPFDTPTIREAVGDLICGVNSYEAYEIALQLRELQSQHADISQRLSALRAALPLDQALDTPTLVQDKIDSLKSESEQLTTEVDNVDDFVEPGDVKDYLAQRRKAHDSLITERTKLSRLEEKRRTLEFELREVDAFIEFLSQLMEKLTFAEATSDAIGSIQFTLCPACGTTLDPGTPEGHCVVCRSPLSGDTEKEQYNQIRLDIEIQIGSLSNSERRREVSLTIAG